MKNSIIMLLFSSLLVPASSQALEHRVAFTHLSQLQSVYRKELENTERKMNQKIVSTQKIKVNADQPKLAMYSFEGLEGELDKLSGDFQEKRLRIEVLDRILFAIEKKFKGGDFRQFLEVELLQLAQRELLSPQPDKRIWKFLLYQSVAIRELAPKRSKIADFVESYMRFSSVARPKMPQEYLQNSHYGHAGFSESIYEEDKARENDSDQLKIKIKNALDKMPTQLGPSIKTSSLTKTKI